MMDKILLRSLKTLQTNPVVIAVLHFQKIIKSASEIGHYFSF